MSIGMSLFDRKLSRNKVPMATDVVIRVTTQSHFIPESKPSPPNGSGAEPPPKAVGSRA
jgi:hypothetical protein